MAISILGAWVEGRDSAFSAGLSRDVGQILAEDTSFLVYDLRKKHGQTLDSARMNGLLRDPALLTSLAGSRIKWGLALECAESREEYACAIEAIDMADTRNRLADTLRVLPEAKEKRKLFGQAAAGRIHSMLYPDRAAESPPGSLKFRAPINAGMVTRGVTVIRRGAVSELPLGATLIVGDAPGPFAAGMAGVIYVFYPQSSYTYLLPRVLRLNHGSLGIAKGPDSSSLEEMNRPAAMDSSNPVWKNLGQISALDSTNPIWRKLGEIGSLDSNSIWRKLAAFSGKETTVVLTPSFMARGEAQAVLIRHEGSVSTLEALKAGMSVRPLLSSQEAVPVAAMRLVRTRGYSLKQERLASSRADRILREFEAFNAGRGTRAFSKFLPGKLFSSGTAMRTPGRPVQAFIASGFRELDMEVGVLSGEKEVWSEFSGTFRPGSHESGCYLCSPDRLGP